MRARESSPTFFNPSSVLACRRMKTYMCFAMTAALLFLSLTACSHKTSETRVMTERERDSTIAVSKLPGAGVVGKALEQADSAQARANRTLPP